MIKYMVLVVKMCYNRKDEPLYPYILIKSDGFTSYKDADDYRTMYIKSNSDLDPQNVSVLQYKQ